MAQRLRKADVTLLSVKHLIAAYPAIPDHKPVSLTTDRGEVVWIGGPSGAGKTTLLLTLARLAPMLSGEMYFQGVPWGQISPIEWRSRVAYLHQKAVMFQGTVDENLHRAFSLRKRKDRVFDPVGAARLLDAVGIPHELRGREAATLSVGEAARVALVRTLITEPQVLLLDEPTAPLDPVSREGVQSVLQEWLSGGDRAIVAVSHDEDFRASMPGSVIDLGCVGCRP